MLILSKFHDYYDPVLKQVGVDKTIVYERHHRRTNIKIPFDAIVMSNPRYWSVEKVLGAIVFCGKLHPFLYTEKDHSIAYDLDVIREFVDLKDYKHGQRRAEFEAALIRDYSKYHQEVNAPVIALEFLSDPNEYLAIRRNQRTVYANPCLKLLEFYKVKHPVQAFQEIMMFISGVLGTPEKVGPPMTSRQKMQSHGFDKWSFRKDTPPTRKQ